MQSTSVLSSQSAWRVGLNWFAGAFVASINGFFFFISVIWKLEDALTPAFGNAGATTVAFAAGGIIAGAILGIGAWVVLREWAGSLEMWVVLSATGFGIGATITGQLFAGYDIGFVVGGAAVMGLTLGLAQWVLLRQVPRAPLWIVANAAGLAAAFWCLVALGGEGREGVAMLASSAAYAVITALALVGILNGEDSTARAHPVRVP